MIYRYSALATVAKRFLIRPYALLSCTTLASLAGCGAPQPIGAEGAMLKNLQPLPGYGGRPLKQSTVSNGALLYVTNDYNVTVYSYPRGQLVGKLKDHFQRPVTECSDKAGNVYITDGDKVFVYEHGGTKPVRILTYTGYLTVGCSTNPATGDLAVTYELGFSKAYVAVYAQGRGTPTLYQYKNLIFAYCGYDSNGDLYVDGTYGSGEEFGFVELPSGGNKLKLITLNQNFMSPGIVQWDGTYVTVGDNTLENIYRFAFSGSTGTLVGTTSLAGDTPNLLQWWIEGKKVIGGGGISQKIYYWDYPAGGNPIKTISKGVLYPDGITVSAAH